MAELVVALPRIIIYLLIFTLIHGYFDAHLFCALRRDVEGLLWCVGDIFWLRRRIEAQNSQQDERKGKLNVYK